jgi:hypothetical protein
MPPIRSHATECGSSNPKQSLSHFPYHNSRAAPILTHNSKGSDTIIDDSLLHIRHNSPITIYKRLPDLMWLKALLMNQSSNMRGTSSPTSSTATPQRSVNKHLWVGTDQGSRRFQADGSSSVVSSRKLFTREEINHGVSTVLAELQFQSKDQKQVLGASLQGGLQYVDEKVSLYQE